MDSRWDAWKTRNAWWWDFITTPVLLLAVGLLLLGKWYYRVKAAILRF